MSLGQGGHHGQHPSVVGDESTIEQIDAWHDLTQVQWGLSLEVDLGTADPGEVINGSFRDSVPGHEEGKVYELVAVQSGGHGATITGAVSAAFDLSCDWETTIVFQRGISVQEAGVNVNTDANGAINTTQSGSNMTRDIDAIHRAIYHYDSAFKDDANSTAGGGSLTVSGDPQWIDFRALFGHGPLIRDPSTEVQTTFRFNGGIGGNAEGVFTQQYGLNLYFNQWETGQTPVTDIEG